MEKFTEEQRERLYYALSRATMETIFFGHHVFIDGITKIIEKTEKEKSLQMALESLKILMNGLIEEKKRVNPDSKEIDLIIRDHTQSTLSSLNEIENFILLGNEIK